MKVRVENKAPRAFRLCQMSRRRRRLDRHAAAGLALWLGEGARLAPNAHAEQPVACVRALAFAGAAAEVARRREGALLLRSGRERGEDGVVRGAERVGGLCLRVLLDVGGDGDGDVGPGVVGEDGLVAVGRAEVAVGGAVRAGARSAADHAAQVERGEAVGEVPARALRDLGRHHERPGGGAEQVGGARAVEVVAEARDVDHARRHVGGRPAGVDARHAPHVPAGPCGGVAPVVARAVVAAHLGALGRRAVHAEAEVAVEGASRGGERVEERALLIGVPRPRPGALCEQQAEQHEVGGGVLRLLARRELEPPRRHPRLVDQPGRPPVVCGLGVDLRPEGVDRGARVGLGCVEVGDARLHARQVSRRDL
mmetsp:Transcript_21726/g.55253  ORF Transcript_21726/g.55253 Transcript_21726/m.55253 type:complete len:368 (+) Transcript_21726:168-1271(+)